MLAYDFDAEATVHPPGERRLDSPGACGFAPQSTRLASLNAVRAIMMIANTALFAVAAVLSVEVVGYLAVAAWSPGHGASADLRILWALTGLAVPFVAGVASLWGGRRGHPPLVLARLAAVFALASVVVVLISIFALGAVP